MSRFNDLCHQKQLQEVLIHKIVLIHKMVHYFLININFHSRNRVQETRDGELTPAKADFFQRVCPNSLQYEGYK